MRILCTTKVMRSEFLDAFAAHPNADFLLFNMRVGASRATYHTEKFHRVHIWNAGRYPTYSFAVRREKLHAAHVTIFAFIWRRSKVQQR